jgi:hypothetical protein
LGDDVAIALQGNPKGKGLAGRMASLPFACVDDYAARPAPSPPPGQPLARPSNECPQTLGIYKRVIAPLFTKVGHRPVPGHKFHVIAKRQ